jgi:hypothetical protein
MSIDYIDKFGVVLLIGIIAVLAFKYVKYWQQVKTALGENKDATLSLYSQK